ncbi:dentin sialophosphoprotein-like isoform X2 [Herrania umbratica]|uniref:Dentin sialophosphoprotein-like isoform X2 n=1 Tax=Herrania umbratica TaxID=108875 RepID=A0A6J1B1U4_9ROSI|nr:dentin sialophosphoprotein-like isoform X2 [Herrania umbratica]
MEKPDCTSGSGGSIVYNTVFIDTSLDTHLAMIVSDSDTVSDLKKKILYEHPLCFPNIGEIKINALKVKRKGYLYHLSDSMFVKSAFDGVSKSWFLSVDASSAEEHSENHNSRKPGTGNVVACFGITTNNSSADVVDLRRDGTSKRLSNINDLSLPQDGNNHHAKQNSASQQFDFGNSGKENSEDLHMEVEHTAYSNSKVLSRPKVQEKDGGDNKIVEDLPASVAVSDLKEKHKTKKGKKDAFHDHAVKENGASVVESGKDALESDNVNERTAVLNDMKLGNQVCFDETCKSVSFDRNKRSATRKRMADEGIEVPGKHSECATNKLNDVSLSEQEHKFTENSSQSGPASKKKYKTKKKDNENSLIENGSLISDLVKQGTGLEVTTSGFSLGQKLGSTSAILDHLNIESVKDCGRKKRKRQKSNPIQVGREISSAKDVNVDTFQAIEAIKNKDFGSEADPGFVLGAISEPCLISSKKMQEVSRTNVLPHSEGDDAMAGTDDGNMESEIEAPEPSVIKRRDSIDQNASHVNSHPTFVSQEGINLQNDIGVSGHENQSGTLEDKIVEPKASSKKRKKSKKTKDLVGGTEALDAVHDRGPASDIPPERPTSVTGDHLSDNAEQDGTTDGKEASKMRTSNCLPSATDVRADDVIRDVLESLQQCNNAPANAENMDKKSRKKTKKKSSTVVNPPELQGKDDVDHRDSTILADNMSEVSASSKSTRKTKVVNSSSAAQLNGSDWGSKSKTGFGISPVDTQLDSSQNTLKANREGRPIQDVVKGHHPKSASVVDGNNGIEVPCESERIESQHQHEIVDFGGIVVDKVTDKKGVETEVKGKRKKKKPDEQSGRSTHDLSSSLMLNGNQLKKAKAQAAKSSSIQSQRSSSKVEPYNSPVQSSKTCLTISGRAAKEPLQSTNKSEKVNSIPKESQRPIDINSSRMHTGLGKNNDCAASRSTLERSKNPINLKGGSNEHQSHLDIAKDSGSNNRKVVNSLENKKSLLAIAGPIFKHDDKESSDDDVVDDSDDSTRSPSDNSSSDDDSDMNGSSSRNGSYNSEGEGGGRERKSPGSTSPKSMSLHAILRNSSSYKKAKLTASQSQLDDLDSQPDEFVPDSQAK